MRLCVCVCGCVSLLVAVRGCAWLCVAMCGCVWLCVFVWLRVNAVAWMYGPVWLLCVGSMCGHVVVCVFACGCVVVVTVVSQLLRLLQLLCVSQPANMLAACLDMCSPQGFRAPRRSSARGAHPQPSPTLTQSTNSWTLSSTSPHWPASQQNIVQSRAENSRGEERGESRAEQRRGGAEQSRGEQSRGQSRAATKQQLW